MPIGCRRAYFWYAPRDQQSAVPDAVCRCAPIHLPSVPTHSRSLRVTPGILPTPTINCVWKHAAWDVTGPDATIQYLLFGAMFLIAVQRLPNDWLYVVRALPFAASLASAHTRIGPALKGPPILSHRQWECRDRLPFPAEEEAALWSMPLQRRHQMLRPMVGRPLRCRGPDLRCACRVLAGVLRAHFREFPPGSALERAPYGVHGLPDALAGYRRCPPVL